MNSVSDMDQASESSNQTHPFGIYLKIWALLFVLSTFSYLVDFFHLQGYLRWTLVLIFMVLKAGLIMAVFMHLKWERASLKWVLLAPPIVLLVLIALMASEGVYTEDSRHKNFSQSENKFIEPHGAAR